MVADWIGQNGSLIKGEELLLPRCSLLQLELEEAIVRVHILFLDFQKLIEMDFMVQIVLCQLCLFFEHWNLVVCLLVEDILPSNL